MITYESIYEKVMEHDKIYSLYYPEYARFMTTEEQITTVSISKLKWNESKTSCYFIWGWPGPDYNVYNEENYGRTWAFTKEELLDYWRKENGL